MTHQCKNVLVACEDFRMVKNHVNWADHTLGDRNYDLVTAGGSQKAIVDETTRDSILKWIGIGVDLHKANMVVIIAHEDCGAYGGSSAFNDWDEEKAKYVEDMNTAEGLIKTNFSVEVKKFVMMLDGTIEEI